MKIFLFILSGTIAFAAGYYSASPEAYPEPLANEHFSVEEAYNRLYKCVNEVASSQYLGLERLRSDSRFCMRTIPDQAYSPEYAEYGKYDHCVSMASGANMYDLPPEATTEDVRKSLFDCNAFFPFPSL